MELVSLMWMPRGRRTRLVNLGLRGDMVLAAVVRMLPGVVCESDGPYVSGETDADGLDSRHPKLVGAGSLHGFGGRLWPDRSRDGTCFVLRGRPPRSAQSCEGRCLG